MRVTFPKFVKKANQHCITTFTEGKDKKITQEVIWCSSLQEAMDKYNELLKTPHN